VNRFGPEVESSIRAARVAGVRVAIFDDAGRLLWFCYRWAADINPMDQWGEVLGCGWLEFVHNDDLLVVSNWIQAGDGAVVEFRSGRCHVLVRLVKRRVGHYWLAVGERSEPSLGLGLGLGLLAAATLSLAVLQYHISGGGMTV
jgi:hypothetical protein